MNKSHLDECWKIDYYDFKLFKQQLELKIFPSFLYSSNTILLPSFLSFLHLFISIFLFSLTIETKCLLFITGSFATYQYLYLWKHTYRIFLNLLRRYICSSFFLSSRFEFWQMYTTYFNLNHPTFSPPFPPDPPKTQIHNLFIFFCKDLFLYV